MTLRPAFSATQVCGCSSVPSRSARVVSSQEQVGGLARGHADRDAAGAGAGVAPR